MISYITLKSTVLTILLLSLFTLSSNASAARDCEFSGSLDPSISVTDSTPISFFSKTSSAVVLKKWTYTMNIWTYCQAGNDGNDLYSKHNANIHPTQQFNNLGLFETNLPGIYYSIEMATTTGSANSAFYIYSEETKWSIEESQVKDKRWNIIITLYQRPEYDGIPAGITSIRLKQTGYVGYFRIGGTQHFAVDVTMANMDIPVVVPTCTSLVSSVGSGSVNLGSDYEIDDIKNNKTNQVDFTLTASQCSNVLRYKTKLTANNAYKGLLTNNSTESLRAGGVGVKIWAPNGAQLLANDSQSIYTEAPATMQGSKTFNYKAQLVSSSNGEVTSGDFKATGTFSMSYE
jgi:type 1 fimbria pilin